MCNKDYINKKRNSIISAANDVAEIFVACGLHNISCKSIGSKNKLNLLLLFLRL